MKVLVMGGSGMIGCHIAHELATRGHQVTIGARNRPRSGSLAADFPFQPFDYTAGKPSTQELSNFGALVMTAANDIRHISPHDDPDEFWERTQSGGVPDLFARARDAGISSAVLVGSYYHQAVPDLVRTDPYVRARHRAEQLSLGLADDTFRICAINPPAVVGVTQGHSLDRYRRLIDWARGRSPHVPDFAPPGGTNYMSARSLSQAVATALSKGQPGRAYLIGDENLTFAEFFNLIFEAAGSGRRLRVQDRNHPMLPDSGIVPGRGAVISYRPSAADALLLNYERADVRRAINEAVAQADGL